MIDRIVITFLQLAAAKCIGAIIYILILVGQGQPPEPTKLITYDVLSIRVDDDAEYHITARTPFGQVRSYKDLHEHTEVSVQYGITEKPIMKVIYRELSGKDKWSPDPNKKMMVILPSDYEIKTFDD